MKPEARMLTAVALSAAILFAWQTFVAPPPAHVPAAPIATTAAATPAASPVPTVPVVAASVPAGSADPQSDIAVRTIHLRSRVAQVDISTDGGVPTSWILPDYPAGHEADAPPLNAVTDGAAPLQIIALGLESLIPARPRFAVESETATSTTLVWRSPALTLRKQFALDDAYGVRVVVSIDNHTAAPLPTRVGLAWESVHPEPAPRVWWSFLKPPADVWVPVVHRDGKAAELHAVDTLRAGETTNGDVAWTALASRYFAAAIVPREQSAQMLWTAIEQPAAVPQHWLQRISLASAGVVIPSTGTISQEFSIFVGPKRPALLKLVGYDLDRLVDYGWFAFVAKPILTLLNIFYELVHNYGVAIILLTVFVKLLLHPINKSSMASMKKMQQVQPRIAALRTKYKDDPTQMNAEMMAIFRSEKINPAGGCLPMLLQLPVYFALYKVLWNSVELYRAPFFGFYRDLSAPDPYFISPVLLGVAFWLQQKLTPNPSVDPQQAKMMQMMSLLFTGFMLFLPSGLVLYILVNTGVSIFQQWLMQRGLRMRDVLRGRFSASAG